MDYHIEHDYAAQEDDELNLKKGDLVKNCKISEEGWMHGECHGKVGVFPDNFGKVVGKKSVTAAAPASSSEYKTRNRINNQDSNESVSNQKRVMGVGFGDIFNGDEIRLKHNPVRGGGQDDKSATSSHVPGKSQRSNTTSEKARVIFSYKAENADELSLEVGENINIISKELEDEGWWKGSLNGKVGVFPDNFVQLLTPQEMDVLGGGGGGASTSKPTPPPTFLKPVKHQQRIMQCEPDEDEDETDPHHNLLSNLNQERPIQVGKKKPTNSKSVPSELAHFLDDGVNEKKLSKKGRYATNQQFGVMTAVAPQRPLSKAPTAQHRNNNFSETSKTATATTTTTSPEMYKEFQEFRNEFVILRDECSHLKRDFENLSQNLYSRIQSLMKEVDEEKKSKMVLQVEHERLKQIVTDLDKRTMNFH